MGNAHQGTTPRVKARSIQPFQTRCESTSLAQNQTVGLAFECHPPAPTPTSQTGCGGKLEVICLVDDETCVRSQGLGRPTWMYCVEISRDTDCGQTHVNKRPATKSSQCPCDTSDLCTPSFPWRSINRCTRSPNRLLWQRIATDRNTALKLSSIKQEYRAGDPRNGLLGRQSEIGGSVQTLSGTSAMDMEVERLDTGREGPCSLLARQSYVPSARVDGFWYASYARSLRTSRKRVNTPDQGSERAIWNLHCVFLNICDECHQ